LNIYSAAVIQELHEIVKEKDAQIVALEARLGALEKLIIDTQPRGKGGAH
jgi:hypothetical protein